MFREKSAYDPKCTLPTVMYGGGNSSTNSTGASHTVSSKEHEWSDVELHIIGDLEIFKKDNDPKHTAKLTQEDLNTLENVWSILKL